MRGGGVVAGEAQEQLQGCIFVTDTASVVVEGAGVNILGSESSIIFELVLVSVAGGEINKGERPENSAMSALRM